MKRWMKIIAALSVIALLAALYVWFFVYNKPHRDYEKAEPDHILAAEELFDAYRNDKDRADSLYTGMVIQIYGTLDKVEVADSIITAVFVFEQGMFGDEGIRCVMLPDFHEAITSFESGDAVKLKGYCTGYNETDVIIEKSSLAGDE
jgi:hypothetical protein